MNSELNNELGTQHSTIQRHGSNRIARPVVRHYRLLAGVVVCLALIIGSRAVSAADFSVNQQLDTVVYSGEYTVPEMIADQVATALAADPAAILTFKVKTPVIVGGETLLAEAAGILRGLPDHERFAEPSTTVVSLVTTIPFSVDDFRHDGLVDEDAFNSYVKDTLARYYRHDSDAKTATTVASLKTHNPYARPNCGGSPVGTENTVYTLSCMFGWTSTTSTCMTVNGVNNWYVTANSSGPPPASCQMFPDQSVTPEYDIHLPG